MSENRPSIVLRAICWILGRKVPFLLFALMAGAVFFLSGVHPSRKRRIVAPEVLRAVKKFDAVFGSDRKISLGDPHLLNPFSSAEELVEWAERGGTPRSDYVEIRSEELIPLIPKHIEKVKEALRIRCGSMKAVDACLRFSEKFREVQTLLSLTMSMSIESVVLDKFPEEHKYGAFMDSLPLHRIRKDALWKTLMNEGRILELQILGVIPLRAGESFDPKYIGEFFIHFEWICETAYEASGDINNLQDKLVKEPQITIGNEGNVQGSRTIRFFPTANVVKFQKNINDLCAKWETLGL